MANVYWELRERRTNGTPNLSAGLQEYLALEYPRESVGWFLRSTDGGRRTYRARERPVGSRETDSTRSGEASVASD